MGAEKCRDGGLGEAKKGLDPQQEFVVYPDMGTSLQGSGFWKITLVSEKNTDERGWAWRLREVLVLVSCPAFLENRFGGAYT